MATATLVERKKIDQKSGRHSRPLDYAYFCSDGCVRSGDSSLVARHSVTVTTSRRLLDGREVSLRPAIAKSSIAPSASTTQFGSNLEQIPIIGHVM